jgi:hypothetical protein
VEPIRCFTCLARPYPRCVIGRRRAATLWHDPFAAPSSRLPGTVVGTSPWRIASQALRGPPRAAMRWPQGLAAGSLNTLSRWAMGDALSNRIASCRRRYAVVCGRFVLELFSPKLRTTSRPPSHGFIPFACHRIWPSPCLTPERWPVPHSLIIVPFADVCQLRPDALPPRCSARNWTACDGRGEPWNTALRAGTAIRHLPAVYVLFGAEGQ